MRIILFFFLTLNLTYLVAQSKVEWEVTYLENESVISFHAKVEGGWHIYSQYTDPNIGPVPTDIVIDENDVLRCKGKPVEPVPTETYDENFGGDVKYFEDEVTFRQEVKVKESGVVKGTITYMVCNDSMCLPPVDETFELRIEYK